MSILIRCRRFPLERTLPIHLYYSTNTEKAKKLVHIKHIRRKLIAIKRSYMNDLELCRDKKALLRGYKEQITAIEERYTTTVLPRRHILVWIPRRRRKKL